MSRHPDLTSPCQRYLGLSTLSSVKGRWTYRDAGSARSAESAGPTYAGPTVIPDLLDLGMTWQRWILTAAVAGRDGQYGPYWPKKRIVAVLYPYCIVSRIPYWPSLVAGLLFGSRASFFNSPERRGKRGLSGEY